MIQKLLTILTSIIFSCGLLVGCVSNDKVGQEAYDILFLDTEVLAIERELMEYGIEMNIEVKGDTVIMDLIIPNYMSSYIDSEEVKFATESGKDLLRYEGNEGHIRIRILDSNNDVILEAEDGKLLN